MSADFLDSNIFLYTLDSENREKREIAYDVLDASLRDRGSTISYQVVQEVLNGMTRKVSPRPDPHDITLFVDKFLMPLWRVMPTRELYARAIELHYRYQIPFYDTLIVASALEARCTRLLTEDFQDGQVIQGLRIENPFAGLA